MKNKFLKSVFGTVLLVLAGMVQADDIDLFVGAAPSSATELPNVLIILDNTANWNTAFANEKAALVSVFNGLTVDKFNVGLMMFSETGGGNSGNDGGYVRAAIRLMNSANKTKYADMINSLDVTADKSNSGKAGKAMEEAYLYLSGGTPHAGNAKNKTDYTGNTSGTTQSNAVYAISGNALASKTATTYNNPVLLACSKNYIIYISNGKPSDNASDTSQATTALATAGGSTTTIALYPSGSQDNIADEWARFMKISALKASVYTIDIDKVSTGQGPGWTALLKSMASQSSGKYFDVASSGTGSQISNALNNIFSEIQSVNSVFASVSLPVSVNTQGSYLNQVFIGMFRPDQDANPRWAGNLKQYKIGFDNTNTLRLLDADNKAAVNTSTGFITECARSFWTPTATDNYWINRPQGSCITGSNSAISNPSAYGYDVSNAPDGNIVEKGAQAYRLRSTITRTVKTCSSTFASCTSLLDFNNTNVTSLPGAADSTERDTLINWMKGLDVAVPIPNPGGIDGDENVNGVTLTEMRQSAHGDVVHSRPIAVNFGTDASPSVVVFYGGNDGVLRAVNGNRSTSIGSVAAGGELWAFVAPEFFSSIKRLRDNTTPISFKGSTTAGALPKPYGFDGPVTGFQGSIGGTPKVFVYATMRRGGRVMYAFDVTNPASPSLKWKKGCPNAANDDDCTTGFTGIGQTWSSPKTLKSSNYGSGASPMLIMGGGYDSCEDTDNGTANHSCSSSSKGNKIYVLDADNGNLLQTLNTDRSVVGDVTVVPDSATGLAKYAYAADLGGNVYRINIGAAAPASWTITKIASLGCDTVASCAANRKFMFGPDVVEENGNTYLLIGSGDREKPLTAFTATTGVANHFFMIKDKPADATWLTSESTNCDGSAVICRNSLLAITTSADPTQAELDAKPKGWYLGMSSTEQVVTSSITLYGVVTFSTHKPAVSVVGSCGSNLGQANVYNIKYLNATSANGTSSRSEIVTTGGLSASPVVVITTTDDGKSVTGVIGASSQGSIEFKPCETNCGGGGGVSSRPKSRAYWYIQK